MTSSLISPIQLADFNKKGFLILRDFYRQEDIRGIKFGIYDIIGRVFRRNGLKDNRPEFSEDNFDTGFQHLISINRSFGSEVYDSVKQIPAFLRLVSHECHEQLFLTLRPGSRPGIAGGGYGIRIDNPHETRFRTHWHQEYPAQLRSLDGIVFWSPLVSITQEIGPVSICVGSHREGPLPVFSDDKDGSGRSGPYSLRIVDEAALIGRYPIDAPLTSPTDLIILDFLVLHSSGFNVSSRSRWSMQFRYFNFADPTGTAHSWQGSFASNVDFREVHPELYISGGKA